MYSSFLNGISVVMADDSVTQIDRNKAVCTKYGMKILGAYSSGDEMLKSVARLRPQIVLLDIVMRGMTGVEVAQAIRKLGIVTKIVLITSMGQKMVSDPKTVGADYLLIKPFPDEWFLTAILGVLADTEKNFDLLPANLPDATTSKPPLKPLSTVVTTSVTQVGVALVPSPFFSKIALMAHRIVTTIADGSYVYNDATQVTNLNLPTLITTASSVANAPLSLLDTGSVFDASWNWALNNPVFLGSNGQLTQIPPTALAGFAFLLQVGYPLTTTSIYFDPLTPIVLVV